MNKIKNTKGFTLMEMLIVVAIIAVLVAIAIPTFTTSLNKARVATDQANIRSGYASVMAEELTKQNEVESGKEGTITYYLNKDGSVSANKDTAYECVGTNTAGAKIAGINVEGTNWKPGATVKYTYKQAPAANEKPVTITIEAP